MVQIPHSRKENREKSECVFCIKISVTHQPNSRNDENFCFFNIPNFINSIQIFLAWIWTKNFFIENQLQIVRSKMYIVTYNIHLAPCSVKAMAVFRHCLLFIHILQFHFSLWISGAINIVKNRPFFIFGLVWIVYKHNLEYFNIYW